MAKEYKTLIYNNDLVIGTWHQTSRGLVGAESNSVIRRLSLFKSTNPSLALPL
jgi:hypothetical protein